MFLADLYQGCATYCEGLRDGQDKLLFGLAYTHLNKQYIAVHFCSILPFYSSFVVQIACLVHPCSTHGKVKSGVLQLCAVLLS